MNPMKTLSITITSSFSVKMSIDGETTSNSGILNLGHHEVLNGLLKKYLSTFDTIVE
jgi:hypothetical protein